MTIFILTSQVTLAREKSITFNHYTHADGLSNNWIFSILQDDRGFLWVGTWDGLSKFDGKDFNKYIFESGNPDGLPGHEIRCIMQAPQGLIAIGTENGLCFFSPLSEKFNSVPFDSITAGHLTYKGISSIASGNNGDKIWVGGNGLFSFNEERKCLEPVPGNLNENLFHGEFNTVNQILTDQKRLWLATTIGIVIINTDDYSWKKINYEGSEEKLPGLESVSDLLFDETGTLWAATWGAGLAKIDTTAKTITDYFLPEPEKKDAAHNILNGIAKTGYPGEENILWISGITGGLFAFDIKSGEFRNYGARNPDDPGRVYQESYRIYYHEGSGLWIGSRLGLYHYDYLQQMVREYTPVNPDKFKPDESYYYPLVYADPADQTGKTVWLGTNNLGLYRYHLQTGENIKFNDKLGSLLPENIFVSDILQNKDQKLWIATLLNGMIIHDPLTGINRKICFYDQNGDTIRWINEFIEDGPDSDYLWVGTSKGLFLLDKQTDNARQIPISYKDQNLDNTSIHSLCRQSDGVVWFIGYNPLIKSEFICRLNPVENSAVVVTGPFPESGESYLNLTDLALAPGNNLFVSSHKGLFNLFLEGQETILKAFMLNGKEVKSRLDQLLVDKQGLIWALRSGNVEVIDPGTSQVYSLAFENLSKNAWLNLNLNDITGEIMIGGWFKIYTVKSDSNLLSRKKLPLYITGIQTNHENSEDKSLDFTRGRIDLPYKQNSITVEYTAINYRAGTVNQYAYRMMGYDDNWVYTGNESVSFKLPPGKYSFQLRSSNASGIWDDEYVFTDIVIRPPFYRTWWFALVMLILIAVIIYIIYRYRINQLLKLQYIRDKISKDLHDDIGSSLTNIAIMNEMAREETRKGGDTEKMLSKSAEDIHEVISSLSDIVWNVNPEFDDLSFLIARMRRYASEVLESADIDFNLDFPEFKQKVLMNMAQRRDFYLVYKEGLNNLVKYSKAEHAYISINIINDEISLFIQDDGVGFDTSTISFGNGLKNMEQRTEGWGGTFTLESKPMRGTKLSIKMKVRK